MSWGVEFTDDAVRDLEEIVGYIDRRDSPAVADHVLEQTAEGMASLSGHPDRGNHPEELLRIGIRECRQVLFKPYRIIYRMSQSIVCVLLIADGRRDMQALLQRRVLEG